ncbi:MAG: hypothetical protein HYT79_02310 [Elusimicrobia bacterium]|nr:hypothetical protein [Elusimicrobiota bacterium]
MRRISATVSKLIRFAPRGAAVFFFLFLLAGRTLHAKLDFEGKGKAIALEIATNPGGFLYDLHQLTESVQPTRMGRRLTVSSQLLPTLLPFTMGNLSGRFTLVHEHIGVSPQIELFGGYSQLLALTQVDSDDIDGKISGNHYGLSTVWSVHPKARVQVAYETSSLIGKATFKKKPLDVYGTKLTDIKITIKESFVLMGAELLRGERKYLFTQMGFGLESTKLMARVVFSGTTFDWGLTVYPEGALVIYPTFGFKFGL